MYSSMRAKGFAAHGLRSMDMIDSEMTMKHGQTLLFRASSLAVLAAVCILVGCDGLPNGTQVGVYPDFGNALRHPSPIWDYDYSINPAANIRTSGPYDWEDLYRGPNGFPLPGTAQIR